MSGRFRHDDRQEAESMMVYDRDEPEQRHIISDEVAEVKP